jgi:two-component system sensor kinase FixL
MHFSSLETQKTPCSLQAVIDDVVFFVKPQERFRDINIKVDIPQDIPDIMIDMGQIHQVVLNILVNAADSICENDCSEGKIIITAKIEDDNIHIAISDNGMGISDEILPRIFQPHITSKKKGHGLGLSNSKRIINSHNGQIRAENSPDGGAVFTFSLPLR